MSLIREYITSLWKERLKPWLDFRAFMEQRRTILARPFIAIKRDQSESKKWKSPLQFATQSVILLVIASAIATYPLRSIFESSRAKALQADKLFILEESRKLEEAAAEAKEKQRDYLSLARKVADDRERTLKDNSNYFSTRGRLEGSIIPITLLLGSYVFWFILGGRQSKNIYVARSQKLHLTYFVALLFWPTAAGSLLLNIFQFREVFNFPIWVYWSWTALSCLLSLWTLELLYRASKKLSPVVEKSAFRVFLAGLFANAICAALYEPAIDIAWILGRKVGVL